MTPTCAGATLHETTALDRLRGATVSSEQLQKLAPLLASCLGIEIE